MHFDQPSMLQNPHRKGSRSICYREKKRTGEEKRGKGRNIQTIEINWKIHTYGGTNVLARVKVMYSRGFDGCTLKIHYHQMLVRAGSAKVDFQSI